MKRFSAAFVLIILLVLLQASSTVKAVPRYWAAQAPTTDSWPDDYDSNEQLDVNFDEFFGIGNYNYFCGLIKNGSPGTMDNEDCAVHVNWSTALNVATPIAGADFQVKYYIDSVACTDWLDTPFEWTLDIDEPCLSGLDDGFHDVSVDISGSVAHPRALISFQPSLLFLYRGSPYTLSTIAPMTGKRCEYCRNVSGTAYASSFQGSRVTYRDTAGLEPRAHPAREDIMGLPWSANPADADIYQEECAPHTDLFYSNQMMWELDSRYPVQARYFFQFNPKDGEAHDGLYFGDQAEFGHGQMPVKDGARGVAWTSAYVSGFVSAEGNFYFVEAGGAFREMHRDCSVETLVGFTGKTDHKPVFPQPGISNRDAQFALVHANMDFKGDIQEGNYSAPYEGFHTPLDVAPDDVDDETFYVAGYHDNVIWKVVEGAGAGGQAAVTVWAGDVNHTAGTQNDVGHAARFNHPASITYDGVYCVCWYVADQDNHKIRKITKDGSGNAVVTAFAGGDDSYNRLDDDVTLTGTLAFTLGSNAVHGTGTSFTTELVPYTPIRYNGYDAVVESITDNDDLVILANYNGVYGPGTAPRFQAGAQANFTGAATRPGATFSNAHYIGYFYQEMSKAAAQLQSGSLRYTVDSTAATAGKRPDVLLPMTVRTTSTGDVCVLDLGFGSIRCINPSTFVTRFITRLFQRLDSSTSAFQGRGWSWMDIDKWGHSGPLDGIYYGVFQGSNCDQDSTLHGTARTNEAYCWADGSATGGAFYVNPSVGGTFWFDTDDNGTPDGWGPVSYSDPPHYFWLAAVDPNGGVYLAGGGEMGITRVRPRQSFDIDPTIYTSTQGVLMELYWKSGGCKFCNPLIMQYGSQGHNYLGTADMWDYDQTVSDATLISDFGIDVTKADTRLPALLAYMRMQIGPPSTGTPPSPPEQQIKPRLRIHGQPQPAEKPKPTPLTKGR